jgi:hypothetical protein
MNERAKEKLRSDIRALREKGFPISRLQLNYMAKVATNDQVESCRIVRHGAKRDANGERIRELSWITLKIRYPAPPRWRASYIDSYTKTLYWSIGGHVGHPDA